MKQIFALIIIVLYSCQTQSIAQNKTEKLYNEATILQAQRKIDEAIVQLEKIIQQNPKFLPAYKDLAKIYQFDKKNYTKAIATYENLNTLEPNNAHTLYLLSKCFLQTNQLQKAKATATQLLKNENLKGKNKLRCEQLLRNINFSLSAVKDENRIKIENLGDKINSADDEYFPSITSDNEELYFTVKEKHAYANEDIYVAKKENGQWKERKKLGENINQQSNEGTHCISSSGKYLLFASDNYRYSNEGRFDIYLSKKVGDEWKRPVNLGKNVNSRSWDSQPVLSADGRTLFFVSSKSGGEGGADIYYSQLGKDGKFGEAQNIGKAINTPFDEQRPYLHPDGKTLYFASSGHAGFGGSDLYKSTRNQKGEWSKPVNLGFPINSAEDEFGIFISADGNTAYISSDRAEGFGGKDIYQFELPKDIKPFQVNYIKGVVYDQATKQKLHANIKIYDLANNIIYNTLSSDKINGKFLSTIVAEKDYALLIESKGYLPYSKNISIADLQKGESFILAIGLQKIGVNEEFTLKNIFFASNEYVLLPYSKAELNFFATYLQKNPNLKIEIGGHTDNVGDEQSNQILSENRAKAVYNYLLNKGIEASRLQYKGYGESQAIAPNDTEKGRAENRRTSFKVVQ